MILGDTCTRGCHFCNVKTGSPKGEVDWLEPKRVAAAVAELGWKYLVLTAVDRDDLADGGAAIFANTVRMIHKKVPGAKVECLTGDFAGDLAALDIVLDARPEVLAHNLETVERLQASVRDRRANYRQSLDVLAFAKRYRPGILSKSGLMVGLGERPEEVKALLRDLRETGTDIATIGQYLQPTRRNLPVTEFVTPEQFSAYRDYGLGIGFRNVFSGPLVRSSYMADVIRDEDLQSPSAV